MSGPRDESLLLDDVLTAAHRLVELGNDLPDDYDGRNRALNEMLMWNLVFMGEAAKRLSPEACERFDDIPWNRMAQTRDRVVHHYEGIDWHAIRRIIDLDLPKLVPRLIEIRDIVRAEFDADETERSR
ncbi:MAG: DUF86 domain-containing protein [Coriobacteriia bacterium]|nr:DUF86 domain-containing protein [Coriobacteriia bacterium]